MILLILIIIVIIITMKITLLYRLILNLPIISGLHVIHRLLVINLNLLRLLIWSIVIIIISDIFTGMLHAR